MKFFHFKNMFSLIKCIFYFCCLIVMIYQFIGITHNYLSFSIEVNIVIKDKDTTDLPSITFCLRRSFCWRAQNFNVMNNFSENSVKSCLGRKHDFIRRTKNSFNISFNYDNFGQLFHITANLTSLIDCSIVLNVNKKRVTYRHISAIMR